MSRHSPPAGVLSSDTQTLAADASMKPPPQRPIVLADLNVDPPDSENYAFASSSSSVPVSRSHFSSIEAVSLSSVFCFPVKVIPSCVCDYRVQFNCVVLMVISIRDNWGSLVFSYVTFERVNILVISPLWWLIMFNFCSRRRVLWQDWGYGLNFVILLGRNLTTIYFFVVIWCSVIWLMIRALDCFATPRDTSLEAFTETYMDLW